MCACVCVCVRVCVCLALAGVPRRHRQSVYAQYQQDHSRIPSTVSRVGRVSKGKGFTREQG
jgi:hypothetical protein